MMNTSEKYFGGAYPSTDGVPPLRTSPLRTSMRSKSSGGLSMMRMFNDQKEQVSHVMSDAYVITLAWGVRRISPCHDMT